MSKPVDTVSFSNREMSFYSCGSDSVPRQRSGNRDSGVRECDLNSLRELVTLLAHDEVSLTSIINGLPEEYHDALADHLSDLLHIASEVAPVQTSRILSTLLQMELDRATQRRNDIHTFMRGNGVVPKVFEGLLAKVTSAHGGLEEQLVNCCIDLCDESLLSSITRHPEEHFTTSMDSVTTTSSILLEGLDYFNSEAAQILDGIDDNCYDKSAYATSITVMSLRILDVVHNSLREWPWSLRESLRDLLETIEFRLDKKSDSLLEVTDNEESKLTSLGQNVMATIVVLRAVIPALLGTVPRLLPGGSCFDREYILLQKRFTMLAKVIQKAAHGLLFNGPHEKGMIAFNNELPTLTQHCLNIFLCISRITEPPVPSQDKSILESATEVTLKFQRFLDNHLVYLMHASMKYNPMMEPVYWTRIMRLTAYGENRLACIDRFIPPVLSAEVVCPPNVEESSTALRRSRRVLGLLSRLGNIRLPYEMHTITTGGGSIISTNSNNNNNTNNNTNRSVMDLQHEDIFNELISYALKVTVNPNITGLHVCFCSIIGLAADNTVAIVVYWDLLRIYLENYYRNEETKLLQTQCPQFYQYRKHSGHRDGDSLAFLFLLVDVAIRTKKCKGFRLILLAGRSKTCFSWIRDALSLLPSTHATGCVQVLLFGTGDVHVSRNEWGVGSFDVMVINRARELLTVLEELHLCLPLGPADYRMLLEEKKEQEEQEQHEEEEEEKNEDDKKQNKNRVFKNNTEKLFPSLSGEIIHRALKNELSACGTLPLLLFETIERQDVRLWPLALMRDVFGLICTAILPLTVFTTVIREDVQPLRMQGVPASVTGNFRMRAVEFFYKFDGDLLLHLEIVPKWLREAISHSRKNHRPSWRRPLQVESRFRISWFSVSHEHDGDVEANESNLLHVLFLISRRYYTLREFHIRDGSSILETGWPNIILSLRHCTLESLWRLLLYNLWSTFAWVRQILPLQCPIMCMVTAIRSYLKESFQTSSSSSHGNDDDLKDNKILLHVAADALASTTITGVHLVQFLVDICSFVRLIDFEGLSSVNSEEGGSSVQREDAMVESVLRIIFRNEKIGDAEMIVARLIASQGIPLLNAVQCLPLRNKRE
ncbi:uncharacterized protein TM35_000172810 [Trypanosoma theileri]|uniref:Ras-GAP domain-containing protein n=1 Tax=Trypanosoma theileri TaxID=67003 RepID=A0A1X0NW26_9TRYP|nr:uncharacterized protein TM35_000172810 [Trypanosoma theileri]ORC88409.1 hypothetical protein TM35_000172810 [Trypanosoma theileri]